MGHLLLRSGSREEDGGEAADAALLEQAKYIPIRLTYEERKQLRTLEAALAVSEYTSKLDSPKFQAKGKRLRMQLQEICGFLSGLVAATDYSIGQCILEAFSFCLKSFKPCKYALNFADNHLLNSSFILSSILRHSTIT